MKIFTNPVELIYLHGRKTRVKLLQHHNTKMKCSERLLFKVRRVGLFVEYVLFGKRCSEKSTLSFHFN